MPGRGRDHAHRFPILRWSRACAAESTGLDARWVLAQLHDGIRGRPGESHGIPVCRRPRSGGSARHRRDEAPTEGTVDRAVNRITFTNHTVHLVVLASPLMPAENFRIAGMVNPAIVVPAGATVSIELVNADDDMAHGLAVTANGSAHRRHDG